MSQSIQISAATRPAPRVMAPTVAGFLVGVQAALLSWILVVTPVVAAFTATSGQEFNAGLSWADAARFGSDLWVLGHFGWTVIGSDALQAVVTISPLGIPLVSALACAALTRVTSARGWPLISGGVMGFLVVDAFVAYVLADRARPSAWLALIGGAGAAAIGLLRANRPHNGELLGGWRTGLVDHVPAELRFAFRGAATAAGLVLVSAFALVVALAVGGWSQFGDLFGALGPGVVGGIALAGLCLALLPNLVAWAVAYVAGPGFAVGAGTEFSAFATQGGVEPALPLLGLLPATKPPAFAVAVVAVPVLAGLVAGWRLRRRLDTVWWRALIAAALASLAAAAALAALVALAGGAGGPGRLAEVGAPFWPLAGWLWLELGVGAAVGALVGRHGSRRPGVAAG
ncbi:MAG: DUF6350 family protein [Bifidobacteriaceae bacterium]|jgi:hypothetical protein|nr:DUF6350 family protein [Bifidobacteriaceae bacterium]